MNEQFITNHTSLILTAAAIELVLKGFALWVAARKGAKVWYILLLVLNTVGILPLAYIFYFSKQTSSDKDAS